MKMMAKGSVSFGSVSRCVWSPVASLVASVIKNPPLLLMCFVLQMETRKISGDYLMTTTPPLIHLITCYWKNV